MRANSPVGPGRPRSAPKFCNYRRESRPDITFALLLTPRFLRASIIVTTAGSPMRTLLLHRQEDRNEQPRLNSVTATEG